MSDLFVVRLPDGTLHYARPGHVDALCGANRVSNGDRWTGTADDVCPACVLLRGKLPPGTVECPDCGTVWAIDRMEPCPGCGLAEEDIEAGADFWIALHGGEL